MAMQKRVPPILLGRPSPSLARIKRMNMADLSQRIERLKTESQRIERRIKHLKIQDPLPQAHIDNLVDQIKRLETLEQTARERLAQKEQRMLHYNRQGSGR